MLLSELFEDVTVGVPNAAPHKTRRFNFMSLGNRRFMFNPKTGYFILGDESTTGGNGAFSSHAEEYFSVTGGNRGYDEYVRGWVGGKARGFKNGVIHFSPPINGKDYESTMHGVECIRAFVKNGANSNTMVRGFGTKWETTVAEALTEIGFN